MAATFLKAAVFVSGGEAFVRSYTTLKELGDIEYILKRSRFIGTAAPASDVNEASSLIARIKSEHRDANHHCYAYSLKDGKQRYSDDGEPHGTAGIPILEVLKNKNITDGIVIVTRYFGGTLLGAPGLVRAYSHTAKLAVDTAGTVLMQPCSEVLITAPYMFYNKLCLLIKNRGGEILDSAFTEHVSVRARIAQNAVEAISGDLKELTAGKSKLEVTGELFADS